MAIHRSARLALLMVSVANIALVASAAHAQTATKAAATAKEVEELVVTGTSIRGVQPVGQSLLAVGREEIQATGVATTADLLARTPQFSSFSTLPNYTGNGAIGVGIGVSLRGLPTLVLLDGQRQIGDGALQTDFDINSIPQNAIERIEIVPDGGSAIYGSDAIGGVVNIISRRNLDGFEARARYGIGKEGYDQSDISVAFGKTWASGGAMVSVQYTTGDNVTQDSISARLLNQSPLGGVDQRATQCFPPNVQIAGINYVGPNLDRGTAPLRCDNSFDASLIGQRRQTSVSANVRQQLSEKISFHATSRYSASYTSDLTAPTNNTVIIPSTNPFFRLPPGVTSAATETVLYNTRGLTGGPNHSNASGKSFSLSGGFDFELPANWHGVLTGNYGRGEGIGAGNGTNATALAAAAAGRTTATALDPFGSKTDPATIAAILNQQGVFSTEQSLRDVTARIDGPLFKLPGGELKVAAGAEYYWQRYDGVSTNGRVGLNDNLMVAGATRTVKSIYGEILVPIVGDDNAVPLIKKLQLSGAVRYDDYNEQGPTTNPKIGLNWELIDGLSLRGSYGTSFIAPRISDTHGPDTRANFGSTTNLPPGDPRAGTSVNQINIAGGNPALHPQESRNYSGGFDYSPTWARGLHLSATYYDVLFENRISIPPLGGTEIFTNPIYTSVPIFIQFPTLAQVQNVLDTFKLVNFPATTAAAILALGPLTIIDNRRHNFASQLQTGVDFAGDYRWTTDLGSWTASLDGNRVLKLQNSTGSGAPFLDDVTRVEWRGRGSLGYERGPIRGSVAVNYVAGQPQTYVDSGGRTAFYTSDNFTTVDLYLSYTFKTGVLSDTEASVNILNAFDKDPPFLYGAVGYRAVNPTGRIVWLGLQKKF